MKKAGKIAVVTAGIVVFAAGIWLLCSAFVTLAGMTIIIFGLVFPRKVKRSTC